MTDGARGEAPSGDEAGYRAPAREVRAEVRDRGSRFLALLRPATDRPSAGRALETVAAELPDATHHCWASRTGWPPEERSSDGGEPSGTAGVPILQVLRGAELSDAVLVVARWFGGTKLGKGGLARAYAAAAREAVERAQGEGVIGRRVPTAALAVELPYERLGAVKRLVRPPAVELVEEEYGATVRLVLAVHEGERAALEAALADLGLAVPGGG